MSKYAKRGAYHYDEFSKNTPYRAHVIDLLDVVSCHAWPESSILDVGCGEGLIMHKLKEAGYFCTGIERDVHAIALAAKKGNKVLDTDFLEFKEVFDIVMMLDMLEHVEDPVAFVCQAKSISSTIIIAIPDIRDPHAINEIKRKDVLDFFDDEEWFNVHDHTRHSRHLLVFKRDP